MTLEDIKQTIEKAIPNSTAHIFDPQMDGQHLEAVVISPSFEGIMLVKQHQVVMNALKDLLSGPLHAMALKTFTPSKWAEVKENYNI